MALPDPEAVATRLSELCIAAAEELEFNTYILGVRAQKTLKQATQSAANTWKSRIKCTAGLTLGERWESLGRGPEFQRAEIRFIYDVDADRLEIERRGVYLYGRYVKLVRNLPQTDAPWRCRTCDGEGCEDCDQTGKRFATSVERILGEPALAPHRASGYQLHGLGREDIDVRCLGSGRPFVLELSNPATRTVDLQALAAAIESDGRLQLPVGLRRVDQDRVARVKNCVADKVYRAVCTATEGSYDPGAVPALQAQLSGATLEQRTPVRVSRRRADKVRRRTVRSFVPSEITPEQFVAEIDAQSGTYIKELISSDEGRTTPSVAALLGVPSVCSQLDVLEIRVSDEELLSPEGGTD